MSTRAPAVGGVLVATIVAAACGSGQPAAGLDQTGRLAVRLSASYSSDSGAATIEALAHAGIAVVDSPASIEGPVPGPGRSGGLRLTRWQVANIALDSATHSGLQGADIDSLVPLPPGAPPFSYLLAAYVKDGGTANARLIRDLMGKQDWVHADGVVFPIITFAGFVADATSAARPVGGSPPAAGANASIGLDPSGTPGTIRLTDAVSAPCSAVRSFVDDTLNFIFNLLQLAPSSNSFLNFIAGIWNSAISLAHTVVGGLIGALTKPVVQAIASAVGAVGTILEVVSLLRPYTVWVQLQPTDNTTSAVPGDVVVKVVNNDLGDWPAWIVDCAGAAGITLPPLRSPKDAPVTWTVQGSGDASQQATMTDPDGDPLIEQSSLDTALRADGTAVLHYLTAQDPQVPPSCREGIPEEGVIPVRVDVQRADVEKLQGELTQFLTGGILGMLPGQVQQLISPALGYLTGQVLAKLSALVSADFGFATLLIAHHEEPRCSTPSPSATAGPTNAAASPPADLGTCADYIHPGDAPTQLNHEQRMTSTQFGGYVEVICTFLYGGVTVIRFGSVGGAHDGYQAAAQVCANLNTTAPLPLGDEAVESSGQSRSDQTPSTCAVVRKGSWVAATDWNEDHVTSAQVNRLLEIVVPRIG